MMFLMDIKLMEDCSKLLIERALELERKLKQFLSITTTDSSTQEGQVTT